MDDFNDAIRDMIGGYNPTVSVEYGTYTVDQMLDIQPKTAEDGIEYAKLAHHFDPSEASVEYTNVPVSELLEDPFVESLGKYVDADVDSLAGEIYTGEFSETDYGNMWGIPFESASINLYEMSNNASRGDVRMDKVVQDVLRARSVLREISSTGEYWPIWWWRGGVTTLDGAHRAAVFAHLLDPSDTVDVWTTE